MNSQQYQKSRSTGHGKFALEQKDRDQNRKEPCEPNLRNNASEDFLRQILEKFKKSSGASNEDLAVDLSRAFELFQSGVPGSIKTKADNDKDRRIRERITALQNRTAKTLQVITDCKEKVNSVILFDMKSETSSEDLDDPVISENRSLDELTEEMEKLQNHEPCQSAENTIKRPDIEDMKNATHKLLIDLERISKSYSSGKNM